MTGAMTLWFVLLGTTFAVWAGVMAWALIRLSRQAAARRARRGTPGTDTGRTFREVGKVLRDPGFAEERRAMASATLALFLLILSRPYFMG